MPTPFEIPLSPNPQQLLVPLAGVTRKLSLQWNVPGQCWTMDILTNEDVPILSGIPLVTGANMLRQYAYLNLGGAFYVQTDHDMDAVPTFKNLGIAGRLYFVPNE